MMTFEALSPTLCQTLKVHLSKFAPLRWSAIHRVFSIKYLFVGAIPALVVPLLAIFIEQINAVLTATSIPELSLGTRTLLLYTASVGFISANILYNIFCPTKIKTNGSFLNYLGYIEKICGAHSNLNEMRRTINKKDLLGSKSNIPVDIKGYTEEERRIIEGIIAEGISRYVDEYSDAHLKSSVDEYLTDYSGSWNESDIRFLPIRLLIALIGAASGLISAYLIFLYAPALVLGAA